ncbi:hypothetical protein [Agrobacterium pusense]|uniref:hypothetical protein n=1 Tax=Agrobacterium pusense TaxID=648995 RepID=UPI000D39142C|nr:hypothetical protein [Agrobacterium pusense]PTV70197.1 hypothetical protein DBL06_25370 [Agrobacterium pusense]
MRPHFEELFRKHSYHVRPDAHFNVGMGWQHSIQQASAALAGFPSKVWIKGANKEDGGLVLDVDFEGEPDLETTDGVRKLLQTVRDKSLTVCEACGKPGSPRGAKAVRCDEHADLIPLAEAAKMIGMYQTAVWHIIDVGDVLPALTILHDGTVWHEKAEFGFTAADIIRFQEERDRRKFKHVHEQHSYVVPAAAKFACGPGWENVIRQLAERLGRLPGPPKLVDGKEKFGSFQCRIVLHTSERMPELDELAREARKLSLTICEECGAPGRLRMGQNIAKTTCDRHAHLAGPLREDDGWIVDLPPTGGPVYADGQQGRYGIDRNHPEVERQKRIEAAMGILDRAPDVKPDAGDEWPRSNKTDAEGHNGGNNRQDDGKPNIPPKA